MISPISWTVFKNHHDTWSFVVEATNDDGVRVLIQGRKRTKRNAAVAAALARLAMAAALESL